VSAVPARRAALRALARVRQRAAYGPETLAAVLASASLSREDAAFATRLTYGTLQTSGVLDEAIDRFAVRPGELEPGVRDALRVGAYELLYMRTPARAAVHEAVESVKRTRPRAAAMANAILRRLATEAATFPWGDPETDLAALARLSGHPEWIAELLVADLGHEAARAVMDDANEPAPLFLWQNPFLGSMEHAVEALIADGARPRAFEPPGCLIADEPAAAVTGSAVADGVVLVADAAAQLAPRVVGPRKGWSVVDLAAGRGTKTAELQALAVASGGPCGLLAVDVHPFKTRLLAERLEALRVPHVTVVTGDATDVGTISGLPAEGGVDAVLLDVPCSGLGTLRRRPDKRWRLAREDLVKLAGLQATLLAQAASLVRVGGLVVYSTCSLARQENHDIVAAFLRGSGGEAFRVRPLGAAVPGVWADWVGPEGWFQSLPRRGGPDGHFVAALERTG
jgi:16S rRNA (cytosine967-C5)-methyltransferase